MNVKSDSKGRPIISTTFAGKRAVLVGDELHTFEGLTFHDFLVHYLKQKLTLEWFRKEVKNPRKQDTPFLNGFMSLQKYKERQEKIKAKPKYGVHH